MEKIDYKKKYKELYLPPLNPVIIDVPKISFITVEGKGDPNDLGGEYSSVVSLIYGLTYTIKMDNSFRALESYFDYTVPPLEGLWWYMNGGGYSFDRKSEFCWIAMIRQPEFLTQELFSKACDLYSKKKPSADISKAMLSDFTEGLCVQCMHLGSYDDEPATVSKMDAFAAQSGYSIDLSDTRRHHEIYLSDPSKVEASRRKTVVRHPIRKNP